MESTVDFVFLDSGTGGIPYMLSLKEKSPASKCVYLGDTIHFPYGEKSAEEVIACASDSVEKIISAWNPRVIVVACNTISVTALAKLRDAFPDTPFVGTVPAIKVAAAVTHNRRVGLLATNVTINHPYTQRLIDDFAQGCTVFKRGDPALVGFIERSLFTSTPAERRSAVMPAVDYFFENDCDTVVLACTHFTHIARDIRDTFRSAHGADVAVLDSREGVSNRALDIITRAPQKTCGTDPNVKDMSFFVTNLKGNDDKREYATLCGAFGIPFGGVLR